ncbi:MAG: tetratricopeptide repeat protein [Gemmatimonadaceae bacterium]
MMQSAVSMRLVRYIILGAASSVALRAAAAQSSVLARADAAFVAEDRARARRLYEQVVRDDPEQSRAVFRLAQLEPVPARSLALYRRYVALEPGDAWGHMALGDQFARMRRLREALAAYDEAARLTPNERDVVIGRARILSRAGRSRNAEILLATWTRAHDTDAEAWDLLGREQLRAGRPRAAARSFERAQAAGALRGSEVRLRIARRRSAPALEPRARYERDSDGNATLRAGMAAALRRGDGVRLGGFAQRGNVSDGSTSIASSEGGLRLSARPAAGLRLETQAAINAFSSSPLSAAWTQPQADLRLRWREMPNGPALELRAQHLPLGTTPALIANRVTRSAAHATLDIPLAGQLRLRGSGGAALLHAMQEAPEAGAGAGTGGRAGSNRRLDTGGAIVASLGGAGELSARYQTVAYERASLAGYFAPRLAETVEGGIYLELGADGQLAFSADLGAGVQRMARQGEQLGVWKPALRAWTYTSLTLSSGRVLWLEVEGYDAPFAPAGVAAAPSWRYVALASGLRWAIR